MRKKVQTRSRRLKKRKAPKPRNPVARALKESGQFRPRVVETKDAKGRYRRRPKHAAADDDGS